MSACPKGHHSTATDYCDECGAPIGAPAAAAGSSAAGAGSASAAASGAPDGSGGSGGSGASSASSASGGDVVGDEPCPDCDTPRGGRFCEVCGHDFLAEAPTVDPADAEPVATPLANPGAGPGTAAAGAVAPAWRIVVAADPAFHARVHDAAPAGTQPVPFPAFCPERRFVLAGGQMLLGRRSRSRGVEPDIDLTGPPEDAGVSHTHAILVATEDGGWSVVDLDSANGTYLNDGADPIAPNTPVPLTVGDRVHIGAWTTLTVHGP